ncbi:MAG: diguanylate cyclase [Acholeplasma sp.]|jgi:diguanylate cyclase (GGDEF)-like protein|nr:MAG: diguanylate cyclase [Acholeplasma sp.]
MSRTLYSDYVQREIDHHKSSSLTIFIYIAIGLLLINAIFDFQTLPDQWYYILPIRLTIVAIILILLRLYKRHKVTHYTLLLAQLIPIYLFMTILPEVFIFEITELNVVNFTTAFVVILLPSILNVVSLKQSALLSVIYMFCLVVAKLIFQTYSFSDWYLNGGGFILMFGVITPWIAQYRYKTLVTSLLNQERIVLLNTKVTELNCELMMKTELLEKQSTTDYLTKVYNRRGFLTLVDERLSVASAMESGVALYMIDVDDFKMVNDTYGHITGDDILLHMVSSINKAIREDDLVCRWGGEEFLVMVSNVSKEEALRVAERMKDAISKTAYTTKKANITVTIGMVYADQHHPFNELLQRSDKALLYGKAHGKNQIVVEEL